MMSAGMPPTTTTAERQRDVHEALQHAVHAAQRHVVDADDRQPVEILEPRPQRDELQQVGHDVDVDALAAGELDDAEHLHVLVERQGDVDFVDAVAQADVGGLGHAAEQRQAAIADARRSADGRSSTNPTSLKPSSLCSRIRSATMRPEIAGADDEHALEADAGAPAAAQQIAHELARAEGEQDVEREEHGQHHARDRVLDERIRVVRLDEERADDGQQRREDAADQHGEEVVDARPAAPQPVEPLQLERQRHEQRDERQDLQVRGERRLARGAPARTRGTSALKRTQ